MCKSLITLLRSQNLLPYFKLILVDNQIEKLPQYVSRVPTVIIPSMKKILVADQIFQWLQIIRTSQQQLKSDLQNSNTTDATPQKQIKQSTEQKGNNPIGFITSEMSGISDTYAYTNVDAVPQHTYTDCRDVGKNQIFTAPEQHRITTSTQKTFMERINTDRQIQDREISKVLTEQKQNINIIDEKMEERNKLINTIVEQQQQNISTMYNN